MHFKFQQLCPHVFQNQNLNSLVWNTSFEIQAEEKIMIHSISGKGKTSFIYYLLGLRNDYTGKIYIDGQETGSINTEQWTRINRSLFSTVFQDLQLFEKLSVKDNIALLPEFANNYNLNDAQGMLDTLDIGNKWEEKVGTLSFGQKQRVAIIRALMKPFDFLVCDEPFSHLDNENTSKCIKLIEKRLKEECAGIILSSLEESSAFSEIKILHL